MVSHQEIKIITESFEIFFEENFSLMSLTKNGEMNINVDLGELRENPNLSEIIKIHPKEKIVFLDYTKFMNHINSLKVDGVNAHDLIEHMLNTDPSETIKIMKESFNSTLFMNNYKTESDKRPYELRFFNYKNFKTISGINSSYSNKMITIRGTVSSTWMIIKNYVKKREMRCTGCGELFVILGNRWKKMQRFKMRCKQCGGTTWVVNRDLEFEDFYEIEIESLPEDTEKHHSNLDVYNVEFTHNLCSKTFIEDINIGDAYEFVGVIKLKPNSSNPNDNTLKTYLEVVSYKQIEKKQEMINISDDERNEIKKFLKQPDSINILRDIFGLKVVGFKREKKFFIISKALQRMFNKLKDGEKAKDYLSHMLIVGDYSTGKSEFIEACAELCDREYYITGSATTGVGLTGITEREDGTGSYSIRAGMLARATGSTLFVDEFDKKQNKDDFGVLNEAMSKYSYTITKAGKTRTFKCNTCLILIANPIHKNFDLSTSLIDQTNIAGDLFSRFTVISFVFQNLDMEKEQKINKAMIRRDTTELNQHNKKNVEFIKKCFIVVSDFKVNINIPEVESFINDFTEEMKSLKKHVPEDQKRVMASLGTPRNRHDLMKLIKGVALLHLHETPTPEDLLEARSLMYEFQKDMYQSPYLLNPEEFALGRSERKIEEMVKQKIENEKWDTKIEIKKETKVGKRELLLDLINKKDEWNETELIKECIDTLGFTEFEIDETLQKMNKEGLIFSPKNSVIKILK